MLEKLKKFFEVDKNLTIIDKFLLFLIMLVMIPTLIVFIIITYPLNLLMKIFKPLWNRKK